MPGWATVGEEQAGSSPMGDQGLGENRRWVWPLADLLPAVRSRANHRTLPVPLCSKSNRDDDRTSQ